MFWGVWVRYGAWLGLERAATLVYRWHGDGIRRILGWYRYAAIVRRLPVVCNYVLPLAY